MKSRLCGVVAALLVLSQGVTAQEVAKEKCMKPDEVEADQVRYIETQLRVAALQCRDYRHADLPILYNSFILENRPYLVKTQKPLSTYVKRAGAGSLDGYIVGVANKVSMESSKVSQFCSRAMLAAELAAKTGHPIKLPNLMPVAYERPAAFCKSKRG